MNRRREPPGEDEVERARGDGNEFLAAMLSGAHDYKIDSGNAYEEQCVRHVLPKLGITRPLAAIKAERKERTGVDGLDFLWFFGEFPDCPLQFATMRLTRELARTRWPRDWFSRFNTSPLLAAYDGYVQAMRENGVTSAVGLIFNLPGWQTKMLFHNWRHAHAQDTGYMGFNHKTHGFLWLEPLDQVLAAVCKHWTPEAV